MTLPESSNLGVAHTPYDPPASRKVAPNESAARHAPCADWKQELLDAPTPSEAKIEAAAPRSRPTVSPSQGWALENRRLPPTVVKIPTLASAKVPRRGAWSTPFDGTAGREGAGRPGSASGSPARAAAAKSRAAARRRIIARCS